MERIHLEPGAQQRIERMLAQMREEREAGIRVKTHKSRILTEVIAETDLLPMIRRQAKVFEALLASAPIHILDDELIVGNPASVPFGAEISHLQGIWPEHELDALKRDGYRLDPEDRAYILEANEFWRSRTGAQRLAQLYEVDRLWETLKLVGRLPEDASREDMVPGIGAMSGGYGAKFEMGNFLATPCFDLVVHQGLEGLRDQYRAALDAHRLDHRNAVDELDFLSAMMVTVEAMIVFAARIAAAVGEAANAASDPSRAAELRELQAICAKVPLKPAETFHEALQAYWFIFLMVQPMPAPGMGRLDQWLLPFYEADLAAGRITRERALELLCCLRLKDMQIHVAGGQALRSRWAGDGKWHNCTLGGQLADGSDATNALSYLFLDAALACPVPNHTLTIRVHEGTPKPLITRGLEVAATGLGLPAFVGDMSIIPYLLSNGVDIEEARNFDIAGALSIAIPGHSRGVGIELFSLTRVMELAVHGGWDPVSGKQTGPKTVPLDEAPDFESFLDSFRQQLNEFITRCGELNSLTLQYMGERTARVPDSMLMKDAVSVARDGYQRTMPYENASIINPIGMVNVADALTAIRHRVFETGEVSGAELTEALDSDWSGERGRQIRELCMHSPKYGSDELGDEMMALVFDEIAHFAHKTPTMREGTNKPSALTIGAICWPRNQHYGATADGRMKKDPLAKTAMSPTNRPSSLSALFEYAARVPQQPFQCTELDVPLVPGVLDNPAARERMSDLMCDYFRKGGKHVQINIVDRKSMTEALSEPKRHADLAVRLGGGSCYFTRLAPEIQRDLIDGYAFEEIA